MLSMKLDRRLVTTDMPRTKKSFFYMRFKYSMRNAFYKKMEYTQIFF